MPYERSGSKSALYYSYETGPAHVLMLGSYAAYGHGSKQVSGWPPCSYVHFVVVLQSNLRFDAARWHIKRVPPSFVVPDRWASSCRWRG